MADDLTLIHIREIGAAYVKLPLRDVTMAMFDGRPVNLTFVYWQLPDTPSYDPDYPWYRESAGAVRGDMIVSAEEPGDYMLNRMRRARAEQQAEDRS